MGGAERYCFAGVEIEHFKAVPITGIQNPYVTVYQLGFTVRAIFSPILASGLVEIVDWSIEIALRQTTQMAWPVPVLWVCAVRIICGTRC